MHLDVFHGMDVMLLMLLVLGVCFVPSSLCMLKKLNIFFFKGNNW